MRATFFIENAIEHSQMVALTDMQAFGTDCCLVGGLAVKLLSDLHPSAKTIPRATVDIDMAVPLELAATPKVASVLAKLGYTAQSGNRFVKNRSMVDFLVPGETLQLRQKILGGRAYDSDSATGAAVLFKKIPLTLEVVWGRGQYTEVQVQIAGVESLVFSKISASLGRHKPSDIVDLYNLMQVVDLSRRSSATIDRLGGWRLDEPALRGRRKDARVATQHLLGRVGSLQEVRTVGADPAVLQRLLVKHVLGVEPQNNYQM